MCGIFGFVLTGDAQIDRSQMRRTIATSYRLAESRGKEAAGLAIVFPDRIEVVKRPIRGRAFLKDPQTQAVLNAAIDTLKRQQPLVLLGHTRMVTHGSPNNHNNNQPVIRDGLICLHNGIVVNDGDLWEANADLQRRYEVDTEALVALIASKRQGGATMAEAVQLAFREARGANTIALLGTGDDALLLATTNGSLFIVDARDRNAVAFASERYILDRISRSPGLAANFVGLAIRQISPRHGAVIPFAKPIPQPFRLAPFHASGTELEAETTALADVAVVRARQIVDRGAQGKRLSSPHIASIGVSALRKSMQINHERIGSLRRCTECLLPETFPFIAYDEFGVCQFCRQPRSFVRHDRVKLDAVLARYRRSDGAPECIVPISGGRDSCYSLHYIKKELGLNPVAYTYDWGMVNDLARRNISRMCEALGVEHLLIAADIRRKRDNIRMNVAAWLKRPHLGTIPLFMAGDKQFFYFSSKLMRQMNLPLAIYSMNRLERTDFKVGFCGINEVAEHSKTYGLNKFNTAKIALFYTREFARNPALVNKSIIDTIGGFASYYILPQDYISLFDYIDWNEGDINSTIRDKYGWETAQDASSTWRVGDGTAAFYNYIYYKVAGFSEHDTFRSNQIRQGLISRGEALAALSDENQPRVESFKWYCDTIGLNATDAVAAINRIPELYP